MRARPAIPVALGAAMAAGMLAMLHGRIMAGEFAVADGAVAFVLAHVAVVGAVAALALAVPRVRSVVVRHRPSVRHMALMAVGMAAGTAAIHALMHGGAA